MISKFYKSTGDKMFDVQRQRADTIKLDPMRSLDAVLANVSQSVIHPGGSQPTAEASGSGSTEQSARASSLNYFSIGIGPCDDGWTAAE